MRIEFHTLYWPNTNSEIVESQMKVMKHFNIPINYTVKQIDHGQWMANVIDKSKSDIVCFFDIDCVPVDENGIWTWIDWLKQSKTFFGIAQVSNHIPPAKHIYAAPAFFAVHKECWNKLKVPMNAGSDGVNAGDVCELFTYAAEREGINFKLIYPEYYYKAPQEGVWNLADKGCYGIGTIFGSTVYHLYQSRFSENVELFKTHCDDIIKSNLNYNQFTEVHHERL